MTILINEILIKLISHDEKDRFLLLSSRVDAYINHKGDKFEIASMLRSIVKKIFLNDIITGKLTEILIEADDNLGFAASMLYTMLKYHYNTEKYSSNVIIKSNKIGILEENFSNLFNDYISFVYSTSNEIWPNSFEWRARSLVKKYVKDSSLALTVEMASKDHLPLIHSVGKGSAVKPRMLILKSREKNNEFDYCMIGKGVTYDTGGYNIKLGKSMYSMSYDKTGAVLTLFSSIYNHLNSQSSFVALMPLAENCISGSAYHPGQVIKSHHGLNILVENTDAEGRLILMDAMEYAVEHFEAKVYMTYATLTGAASVATGSGRIACISNDDDLISKAIKYGKDNAERIVNIAFDKDHEKVIQTFRAGVPVIKTLAGIDAGAGTIIGAVFIKAAFDASSKKYNRKSRLIHFDIAPLILGFNYEDWVSYCLGLKAAASFADNCYI